MNLSLFLGILLALHLSPAAPQFQMRKIYRHDEVKIPLGNDETVDIISSTVPVASKTKTIITTPGFITSSESSDETKVKLPKCVRVIQDEFGDRGITDAINWLNKLNSEVIDYLRHRNWEFGEVGESDHRRDRRDISTDIKDETVEEKGETVGSSVIQKVFFKNNETTRVKDQKQMIRIELPASKHSENKAKLLLANETDSSSSSQNSRKRRVTEKRFDKERIELEKITLQFKHLPDSQKVKFCSYLRQDAIKDPLQMLMALLGTVYSKSGEESGVHWDRKRGSNLNKIQDRISRQKLILSWACDDRRKGQSRILDEALRSTGISPVVIDDDEDSDYDDDGDNKELELRTEDNFEITEPHDPRLIVKPTSSRRLFKEISSPKVTSRKDRK